MYDIDTSMILTGLVTGIVFGFLLQKAHVTRYQTIMGQFLFKDFTVLKVMLTAIVTGGLGVWAMLQFGWIGGLHVKNAALLANIVGGLLFGIGMAVVGYCPGTGVAAIGSGSRHAIPALLGMIAGGGVFAEVYPAIRDTFMKTAEITVTVGDKSTSKVTLPDLTSVSQWIYLAALAAIAIAVFLVIERWEARRARQHA